MGTYGKRLKEAKGFIDRPNGMYVHECGYSRIGRDNFDIILSVLQAVLCYNENLDNISHPKQKLTGPHRPSPFFSRGADMKWFNLIAATLSGAKQAYLKAGQV